MPELPEVEVVRRGLERWVAHRTVADVEVLHPRAVRRHLAGADDFAHRLKGHRVGTPSRRGKYLRLPLADTGQAVLAHLGMSGQLLVQPHAAPDEKHLRVRVRFADALGTELRFVDQRTFGGLSLHDTTPDGLPGVIAHIARDPLDPLFDDEAFHQALRRKRTTIKRALLDQSLISGVGNIYADEALWRTRLHYDRPTSTFTRPPHGRTPRPRPGRPERGPVGRRHQLRQPLRQRERRVGLLRPLTGRVRTRGAAVPQVRYGDAPAPVDEPVQLLLPAVSAAAAHLVVALPGGEHVVHPPLQMVDERQQALGDLVAEGRQLVVHARRVGRLGLAVHQAVALQRVQGLGEHLLAHPVDPAAQLVEAQRALAQRPPG
ncbi:hypothetical protein GCM10020295_23220 [Streptomyces cinereospinus]